MKVIIIGNDFKDIDNISTHLRNRFSDVLIVIGSSSVDIEALVSSVEPNLIILYCGFPNTAEINLIERIRHCSNAFLIVLNEKCMADNHTRLLEAGADDIITKPYSPIEISARCDALFRKTEEFDTEHLSVLPDGLTIHFDTKEVFVSNQRIHLTPTEFTLLALLIQNLGNVVSHKTLLKSVWGKEYQNDYYLLKTTIFRLRNKLILLGDRDRVILNERGLGYRCGV